MDPQSPNPLKNQSSPTATEKWVQSSSRDHEHIQWLPVVTSDSGQSATIDWVQLSYIGCGTEMSKAETRPITT